MRSRGRERESYARKEGEGGPELIKIDDFFAWFGLWVSDFGRSTSIGLVGEGVHRYVEGSRRRRSSWDYRSCRALPHRYPRVSFASFHSSLLASHIDQSFEADVLISRWLNRHVAEYILSSLSRVMGHEQGLSQAGPKELHSALCEDEALYGMVKGMKSESYFLSS